MSDQDWNERTCFEYEGETYFKVDPQYSEMLIRFFGDKMGRMYSEQVEPGYYLCNNTESLSCIWIIQFAKYSKDIGTKALDELNKCFEKLKDGHE